jgi:hypothetical protein
MRANPPAHVGAQIVFFGWCFTRSGWAANNRLEVLRQAVSGLQERRCLRGGGYRMRAKSSSAGAALESQLIDSQMKFEQER